MGATLLLLLLRRRRALLLRLQAEGLFVGEPES